MFVEYGDIKGNTPALTYRDLELIVLNKNVFPYLPEGEQRYIVEHESGHVHLDTSNEFLVDAFASSEILGKYNNAEQSTLDALYNNLDLMNNPEHKQRYFAQLNRVNEFKNKNTMDLTTAHYTEDQFLDMLLEEMDDIPEIEDSFFGGRRLTKKQAKKDLKAKLKAKYGTGFFKPGAYFKYKKEYKQLKNETIKTALGGYQEDKWKSKETKKDIQHEGEEARNLTTTAADNSGSEESEPKADNKKLIYGAVGLVILIVGFIVYKKFF